MSPLLDPQRILTPLSALKTDDRKHLANRLQRAITDLERGEIARAVRKLTDLKNDVANGGK